MVSKSSGSAIATVRTLSTSAFDRDQRHAELIAERGEHVALREQAHVDHDLAQLVAALQLQFERALQIFRLDLAARHQDFAQALETQTAGPVAGFRFGMRRSEERRVGKE